MLLHAALATASSCDSCLQDTENDEDVNEDMEICHYSCDSCQKEKSLCSTCQERGLAAEQWNPLLRPCERRLVHKRLCVRAVWIYLVSDCLEKQKIVLNHLQEEIQNSEDRLFSGLVHPHTGEILTWPAPNDPHTDKNIVAACDNYLMPRKGQITSSRTIHVLRDHANPEISASFRKVITRESLLRIDRMSNKVVMDNVAERLETALSSHSSVVFTMATCLQETDESNRRNKVHGEDFEQLSDITITRDCKIFSGEAARTVFTKVISRILLQLRSYHSTS